MEQFRFRKFKIYKDTLLLNKELRQLTKKYFPKEEQFCLTAQLWRAADSIQLNIAEGADRGTDKDFAHFLNIAKTSLNEVVACLDLALEYSYISVAMRENYLKQLEGIATQLTAFRRTIIRNPTK